MAFTRTPTRSTRARRALAGVATLLAAGGMTMALSVAPAGAGTKGSCSGDWAYNHLNIELVQDTTTGVGIEDIDLTEPLVAGQYGIETIAFDGWIGRSNDLPETERYLVQFIDADGNVVGQIGATPDLVDDVDEVEALSSWTVDLTGTAVKMRFVQVVDDQGPNDLVWVGCVGVTSIPEPTTTTTQPEPTTTTTAPPVVPTTVVPADPPTTTPSTEAPSTTAAPVAVLGAQVTRTLPNTGSTTAPLVLAGTTLLVAGAAIVLRARRMA